jgi:site-specific DNA recombinase
MRVCKRQATVYGAVQKDGAELSSEIDGKSGGGNSYDYDVVKSFDAKGEPVRGNRTINRIEAEVVRRVFREYATGVSPKQIAVRLNRAGAPGPAGRAWGLRRSTGF